MQILQLCLVFWLVDQACSHGPRISPVKKPQIKDCKCQSCKTVTGDNEYRGSYKLLEKASKKCESFACLYKRESDQMKVCMCEQGPWTYEDTCTAPAPSNMTGALGTECKTNGGKLRSKPCVFPFTYRGTKYTGCTKAGHNKYWCSVKTNPHGEYIMGYWGECPESCPKQPDCVTTGNRVKGKSCIFPFVYRNEKHNACILDDYSKPWCSTGVDKDLKHLIGQYGECAQQCPMKIGCVTTGGKYKGKPCVFPFIYRGVTHTGCTKDGHVKYWCSVKNDKNGAYISGHYGECPQKCPRSKACRTIRGPGKGKPCIFPFVYKGVRYFYCTKDSDTKAWCSVEVNNRKDFLHIKGKYGYCDKSCPKGPLKTSPDRSGK